MENYKACDSERSRRKPLYNVGINDVDYKVQPKHGGKQLRCPAYDRWASMITRCYSEVCHKKQPAYIDAEVCDEWKYFSNFRRWWVNNYTDGWQLDKDILSVGCKVYSPETCIYVPGWLNKFITNKPKSRGCCRVGVSIHKRDNKFYASCSDPKIKGGGYLGRFETESSAYNVWLNKKLEIALKYKDEMDEINIEVYPKVIEIIKNIV